MAIYVVLRNLDTGHRAGQVVEAAFKHADVLIAKGAIAEYHAPPWDQVPGFEHRAKRLKGLTVAQFLNGEGTDALKLPEQLLERWRCELRAALFGRQQEAEKRRG